MQLIYLVLVHFLWRDCVTEELTTAIKQLDAFIRDADMYRRSDKRPVVLIKDEEALKVVLKYLKEIK